MHAFYYRHLFFANFIRQGGDRRKFYFSCDVMAATEWITGTGRVTSGTEIEHYKHTCAFCVKCLGVISNMATVRNSDVISDSVKIYSIQVCT